MRMMTTERRQWYELPYALLEIFMMYKPRKLGGALHRLSIFINK